MTTYALDIPSASRAAGMTTDYNCYWATGDAMLANIGGVECNTIAEMQTAWALLGKPNNDANSIEVDPQFVDFDGGDYTPQNELVISGGEPDSQNRVTTIGAIQTISFGTPCVLILDKPDAFGTGIVVDDDTKVETEITNIKIEENLTISDKTVTNLPAYLLRSGGSVEISSSYPTFDYSSIPSGNFIGKLNENIYAEIRYTVNGKTPTRTSHLYIVPIVFERNLSGSDTTTLKYKVFYQGKGSITKTTKLRII